MQLLYWTVVVKQEQCPQAKLLVYQLIYVLTFTYGQLWSEIIFLSGVCGLIPRDSSDIQERPGLETLFLFIERWFTHLVRTLASGGVPDMSN